MAELAHAYLAVCLLSLLSSLGRPDYNLPIFSLLYLSTLKLTGERRWVSTPHQQAHLPSQRQQRYFLALVVISILFDIVYVLYWSPLWFSERWQSWTHWSYKLSAWTMWMSGLTTILKIVIVCYLFRPELMVLCGWKAKADIIEEYETFKYVPIPQATR